jgi:glycosyltransferase involved in cell wall biosynthesis
MPGGIIVRTVSEMSIRIDRLLGDNEGRKDLGEKGLSAQRGRYEWETIVAEYEKLYWDLLNSESATVVHI